MIERIDKIILGYVTVSVGADGIASASTRLMRAGLTAAFDADGCFSVPLFVLNKYRSALAGMKYSESGIRGLPAAVIASSRRYGIFCALFIVLCSFLVFGKNIWDVRVSGYERLSEEAVMAELCECGLYPGARIGKGGLNQIELELLSGSEDIGWININRVGRVAYVVIKEKKLPEKPEEESAYSNIVASADCIIESITVKSGIAAVKVGDTVREGELLISGVLPSEVGGGTVNAEGSVIGRKTEQISVSVAREEVVVEYGDPILRSMQVRIFDFSLNIFKKYGKMDFEYVIIEDNEECSLFGIYRLPFEIRRTYVREKNERSVSYTENEIIDTASSRLVSLRTELLADREVLRITTRGGFTSEGYELISEVTVLTEVGTERIFQEKGD